MESQNGSGGDGGPAESVEPIPENDDEGMDVSGSVLASTWHQRDNKQKDNKKNNAWLKSSQNFLQPDGQKLLNTKLHHVDYGEMSRPTARNSTFRNFPKKILIDRIIDSGYFYTGEGDTTMCYKCRAVVYDWKDKDNPATFHEPDCEFHLTESQTSAEETNDIKDSHSQSSMEGTSVLSLLDVPITEANSNVMPTPVVLKPTLAPTSIHGIDNELIHSIMDHAKPHHSAALFDPTQYQSLPVFDTQYEAKEKLAPIEPKVIRSMPAGLRKKFVKKQVKPSLTLSGIIEGDHENMLKTFNLCSEEDRRKTFSIKKIWRQNTNDVVNYIDLAANGFFYLGNLDRTQCFSCNKIFKTWRRGDVINRVHRSIVPYCRMAKGEEEQNIPIPRWQPLNESLSSTSSSVGPLSGPTQSGVESVPESLEISKSTLSSHLGHISNLPFQLPPFPVQAGETQPMIAAMSENPLDLIVNRNSNPPVNQPGQSPSSLGLPIESNINMVGLSQPEKVRLSDFPFPVQPSSDDEEIQMQESIPRPIAGISQTTTNLPPASVSWHLGQTTLYNTTSNLLTGNENEIQTHGPVTVPMETNTTEIQPALPGEVNWSEIFPCNDPIAPDMRTAVARQDTFDYSWTQRGISNVDEFARAGFYFAGDEDNVRCWYCGGGIRHWNNDDDPWQEHARLYPNCEFLLQQKGPEFISEVASRRRVTPSEMPPFIQTARYEPSESSESPENSPYSSLERSVPGSPRVRLFNRFLSGRRSEESAPQVVDPREEEAKHKRMLDEALNSEAMLIAADMGFDIRTIRKTIKHKIQTSDTSFQTPQDLLDALLSAPAGGSDSSDSEDDDEQVAPIASTAPGTSTTTLAPTSTASTVLSTTSGAQGGGEIMPPVSSSETDPEKLGVKLREYEQEKRCKVCLDRDMEVVFIPCGHMCTCIKCANALRNCPLCRKRIQKSMKIYTA